MFLALDTSTLTLSLALVEGRGAGVRVLEDVTRGPPEKQSEILPGAIGELLARHQLPWERLEGIALGLGPGSFTGLRIGLSAVKALAYATGLRVAGVCSLAAAALEGPEGVPLFAVTVARTNELYVGQYRRKGFEVETLQPEDAMNPAQLAGQLAAEPGSKILGPGVTAYRSALEAAGVAKEDLLDVAPWPLAINIARLAVFPAAQDLQTLFSLEPMYVRASEAERNPKFPPLPGLVPAARLKDD